MLNRQKLFLNLLQMSGGQASHLAMTKWCFLIRQETPSRGGSAFYEFVPYRYGPFFFGLYHEAASLVRDGWIEEADDKTWRLTLAGHQLAIAIPRPWKGKRTRSSSGMANLAQPSCSTRSIQGILGLRSTAISWSDGRYRPVASLAVYTIGYEGLLVDDFLNRLLRNGIQLLIDSRNNPVARRYGFHKSSLSRLCERLGVEYRHFPNLGIPSESRQALDSSSGYTELFDSYETAILPDRDRDDSRGRVSTTAEARGVALHGS